MVIVVAKAEGVQVATVKGEAAKTGTRAGYHAGSSTMCHAR